MTKKLLPNPVTISEVTYTDYSVAPLFFKRFVELSIAARDQADNDSNGSVQKAINRAAIKMQVKLLTEDGKASKTLTDLEIMNLTIANGKELVENAVLAEGTPGEIISGDADGIAKSVVYKLGTPIKTANSAVSEIEFKVKTFGDIEAVLAEPNKLAQGVMMLQSVGKSAGTLSLPSWALEKISVADGMDMVEKVLPRFL
jgi:hypothetical protein